MTPQLLQIVAGTSGAIGLLSLMAYYYYHLRLREAQRSERSVREIAEGEGLFNADQILSILKEFKDDTARLNALKTLTHLSNRSAERVYDKIKRVDISALEESRSQGARRGLVAAGAFFTIVALIALVIPGQEPAGQSKQADGPIHGAAEPADPSAPPPQGPQSSEVAVRLADANRAVQDARERLAETQTFYSSLDASMPSCGSLREKQQAGQPLTPDEAAKAANCATARTALEAATAEHRRATEVYEALRQAVAPRR